MSNKFKIAHLREQGVDLIIIPLASAFEHKSENTQQETIDSLQLCASRAGLAGTVIPVWLVGQRVRFIAPTNYHPFFRSLSWNYFMHNINKELTCG
jgi:hypothetical protein